MKGISHDDSDTEWDEEVRSRYGSRWRNTLWEEGLELDGGLDMSDMVQHAFHHYDSEVQFDGRNFVSENNHSDTNDPHGGGADADHDNYQQGFTEGMEDPLPPNIPDGGDSITMDEMDDGETSDRYQPTDVEFTAELMEESARVRLFAGSSLSSLSATLLLLMCCRTHGCSTAFIDELFKLLSKSILPTTNSLPPSEYLASKTLRELGLAYKSIHVCPNSCMLFREEHEADTHCAKCNAPRYRRVGKSWIPAKVLRHFPLLPRIQRMFSTPLQASYLTWHKHYAGKAGPMRCVPDSPQWKKIDQDYPEFASEPRNIRFALATDGVNPFSVKRSTWSTWPVLLLNYNIPPWLTTKKHFILLSLIIPGKKAVTGETWDVFVQPLLEELHHGWTHGVRVVDAANYMGNANFICKFMCMFTINDFPALGIVSGSVTKGYVGCHCCGPATISRRSRSMKKNVYDNQHRMWLPVDHPFRSNNIVFPQGPERRTPPVRPSGEQVIQWGRLREEWVAAGATPAHSDPARTFGIKRVPTFASLPYWKVSILKSPCQQSSYFELSSKILVQFSNYATFTASFT